MCTCTDVYGNTWALQSCLSQFIIRARSIQVRRWNNLQTSCKLLLKWLELCMICVKTAFFPIAHAIQNFEVFGNSNSMSSSTFHCSKPGPACISVVIRTIVQCSTLRSKFARMMQRPPNRDSCKLEIHRSCRLEHTFRRGEIS